MLLSGELQRPPVHPGLRPADPEISLEDASAPCAQSHRNERITLCGRDAGATRWTCLASLIETAKIQASTPKPISRHPRQARQRLARAQFDELLPWTWPEQYRVRLAA